MDRIYISITATLSIPQACLAFSAVAFVALKCQREFCLNFNVLQLCKIKLVASIVIRAESCTDSFYHM